MPAGGWWGGGGRGGVVEVKGKAGSPGCDGDGAPTPRFSAHSWGGQGFQFTGANSLQQLPVGLFGCLYSTWLLLSSHSLASLQCPTIL